MNNSIYNYNRKKFLLPFRLWLYRSIRRILIIFILALIANFVFSYLFYTPKMWRLRELNNEIVTSYNALSDKISQAESNLNQIHMRDIEQYRSVFSVDTLSLPNTYRDYSEQYYSSIGYGRYSDLMKNTQLQLDRFSRQLYVQSLSMDQIEELAVDKDVMMEHLPTLWPMDRNLMRGHIGAFGLRNDPIYRNIRHHEGIDMAGPVGTPVYATGNGIIVEPKGYSGYGIQVMVDHKFGYMTRYAHLSRIIAKPGQWVKRGEVIGLLGNTGKSTGPHLHYEIIHRGQPVNPMNYLSRDMNSDEFRAIIENVRSTTYEQD